MVQRRSAPILLLVALTSLAGAQVGPAPQASGVKIPVAAKQPHTLTIHGRSLVDDYFWLREKTNPAVREYLEAENAYTTAIMKPWDTLQTQIYDEIVKRIKQTDQSVPYKFGVHLYYTRTVEGQQYAVWCRKRIGSVNEEVLLDLNAMAKGLTFMAVGAFAVSDDGNYLAYTTDTTGYRQYVLRIKDLRTGAILPDRVPRVVTVAWAADNRTLFFTTEDSVSKRSDKFWRRQLGSTDNTLLYTEPDELFDVYSEQSSNKKMILLGSYAKTMTEMRYIPRDRPQDSLRLLLPREKDHEFTVDFDEGQWFIRTNKNAKNFRLVSAPLTEPTKWTEVIAHAPKVNLAGIAFFSGHTIVSEREDGLPHLRIIDKKTKTSHRVSTPEPAYWMGLGANREYDTKSIQFNYNSLVTPQSTFEYDLATKNRTLLKQQDVFGYDRTAYESKRIWATARDGTRVPVALVYRKGTPMDGSAPMLLYAYGSYGASFDPTFSSPRVSLLDRGFVYAVASIRGGGELGEEWREAGRMMKKMNTFTDFIDVAEYLIRNKYTSTDRLMIQGGSAGGLLMGAVVNMRPDLFKAVNAQVPFVDVINTMMDASLPLTTSEYIEWGNPNEKAAFDYMIQYSPYDNVKAQKYPALLIEVSFNDSQVLYWEGAKFAAKIRSLKQDSNILLLKTNLSAGHGGSSGRYDRWKEIAFEYAFFVSQLPSNRFTP